MTAEHLFQAINFKSYPTFHAECVGDTIKISKQNNWEITINTSSGTIENWKVLCTDLTESDFLLWHIQLYILCLFLLKD